MRYPYLSVLKHKLVWLIVISAAVRLIFACVYPIKKFPDTPGYFEAGEQLKSGNYANYTGKRPPVYPLLIAATGFNAGKVVILQALMGSASALLFYFIFLRLTRSENISLLTALIFAINPSELLVEFALISETTCTFILALCMLLFLRIIDGDNKPGIIELLILGALTALCVLTRAQYQPLPVLFAIFMAWHFRHNVRTMLLDTAIFLTPAIILIGLWAGFQYKRINLFTVSPDLGYNIMTNTLYYIENAPEKFQQIKESIIFYREKKLESSPEAYGAVDLARQELLQKTGLSYAQLSEKFAEAALATIQEKPLVYLEYVARSIVRFFKPVWLGNQGGIRAVIQGDYFPSKAVAVPYALFHFTCMAVFLLYPLLWIIFPGVRASYPSLSGKGIIFVYSLVLSTAFIQALVEYAENPRFKICVEPYIIGMALWIGAGFVCRKKSDRAAGIASG